MSEPARELWQNTELLVDLLDDTVAEASGAEALALVRRVREAAISLRRGLHGAGRDGFAAEIAALSTPEIDLLARTFTQLFHLLNAAEEQHRIRALRQRDQPNSPAPASIAAACRSLRESGVPPDEMRALLARMLVMPVLTAHPSEPRRRTVLDHTAAISESLDTLDDVRLGARDKALALDQLRESLLALACTEELRSTRPTAFDELRAGLHVFERTLLAVTPRIYRELEDALAEAWPDEQFRVGPFLRWGSWIGGDRDGNPNVTAEVTRAAFERQRSLVINSHLADAEALGRELSISSALRGASSPELESSIRKERDRWPEAAARAAKQSGSEPWREKLRFVQSRLRGALNRDERGYSSAEEYRADLRLITGALSSSRLGRLARGKLRDAARRAQVFGFHLATLDIRQHSDVHARAVEEILSSGGRRGYGALSEDQRVELLTGLLERADVIAPRERSGYSPNTRETLQTFDAVGRARRDLGPEACERWIVSFTRSTSDLLEVLLLARAARLGPDEIRPIPLLEQAEDIERAGEIASDLLRLRPLSIAIGKELEVMLGYSDGGKQLGYVASSVAIRSAQQELAKVANEAGAVLTVFHGRGGAVGRGGGPANRAIRAQPRSALRGRFRVTEQGETVSARYSRPEIAHRDLEQMVNAVILGSIGPEPTLVSEESRRKREAALGFGAAAARSAYERLIGDRERLARYVVQATPIAEISEMRIASRPASRKSGLKLEDLRAIPWVFSWNQSRHGIPGWFGLGSALDAIAEREGPAELRLMYENWPFFRALIDNAQLALARADVEVAAHYAGLADPDARQLFELIRDEHRRTLKRVLETSGSSELLSAWPIIAATVAARNPYVDVLSHVQIELLKRLRAGNLAPEETERTRSALMTTISGIASGLMTAG
jgi:phosphoenolpyruvate carboxylase